nr:unnamed protein product [Callosobruchus chinensis]
MDRVFDNIHNFAIKSGLDPTPLQNFSQKILRAHVVLTNGTFNGVSTIQRKNHVKLIYNHKTRVITVQFPIIFRDLFFRYHYDVGVSLLKEQGGFAGIMKNYKVTIDLNFDFKKYKLKMAKPMWLNG